MKVFESFAEFLAFGKRHWGELYTVIDIFGNIIGKKPPIDKEGKIDYGGLGKSKDEITIDQIEITLTPEEQVAISSWHRWVRMHYGPGYFGWVMRTYYLNKFRLLVMHMIEPPKKKVEKIMKQDKAGKDVVDKVVETEDKSEAYKNAKAFLERFAAQVITGMNGCTGSQEEKINAGCLNACEYLRDKSYPTPSFSEKTKAADEFVRDIPQKMGRRAKVAGKTFGGVISTITEEVLNTYEGVGSWIDQKHDELEERNNRKGPLAGIRRWYRSLR